MAKSRTSFPLPLPGASTEIVEKSDDVAVVTIHGTNDTAIGPDGAKWFQRGSSFSEQLRGALSGHGLTAEIIPFLWSGKNSAWAREIAAEQLARSLQAMSSRYAGVHVVAHSHGGNVAAEAAAVLGWGIGKNPSGHIETLTTVGTPFFEVGHGRWQRIAALVFGAVMWPALILVAIAWVFSLILVATALVEGAEGVPEGGVFFGLATLAMGLLWLGVFLSRRNIARVRRARTKSKSAVFAIWHQNDEAISFLRSVETTDIEAFPPWALFRGARRNAFPFAISITVASLLIFPVLIALTYLVELLTNLDLYFRTGWMRDLDFPYAEMFYFEFQVVLAAPLTFLGAYFSYLLIFGLLAGAGAELLFRGRLNRFITRVFRGIAFGRDSDQMIGSVSPTSHLFETQQFVLSGEVAERMKAQSERASSALLQKYRWSLFNVTEDRATSLAALAQDAMTWDSLIHTTYFDQPELAEIIAARIMRGDAVKVDQSIARPE